MDLVLGNYKRNGIAVLTLLILILVMARVYRDWPDSESNSNDWAATSVPAQVVTHRAGIQDKGQSIEFNPAIPVVGANLRSSADTLRGMNLHARQGGQDFFRRRSGRGRPAPDRSEYTNWEIENQFKNDVFTFVRVQYDSLNGRRPGRQWDNDYPDCDWNFSVRLHELTSLQVDPDGKVIRLTDEELFDYPFIFLSNINQMDLSEGEVVALRKYLLKGGFMMADDFLAPQSWKHVYQEMKKVFPDLEPRELTRDHRIFNLVYDIKGLPQVPSIHAWNQGDTFEYWHGDPQGDEDPHFWGFFDRNDRLMALLCHNNDIGDGWEREGENQEYFRTYSERVSYPLGINIVTYAMTH